LIQYELRLRLPTTKERFKPVNSQNEKREGNKEGDDWIEFSLKETREVD